MLLLAATAILTCAGGAAPPTPVVPAAPELAATVSRLAATAPDTAADTTLENGWARATGFQDWLEGIEARRELWEANVEKARITEDAVRRLDALEGEWRLLVVAADWCQDSAWNVPALARLAEYSDALELRVLDADRGAGIMEARPTPDGRAATPTVVILDPEGEEVGCWIERPARQRDVYLRRLKPAEEGTDAYREAVRDFLGWYAMDNGATALDEVVTLLEAAEAGARGCRTP